MPGSLCVTRQRPGGRAALRKQGGGGCGWLASLPPRHAPPPNSHLRHMRRPGAPPAAHPASGWWRSRTAWQPNWAAMTAATARSGWRAPPLPFTPGGRGGGGGGGGGAARGKAATTLHPPTWARAAGCQALGAPPVRDSIPLLSSAPGRSAKPLSSPPQLRSPTAPWTATTHPHGVSTRALSRVRLLIPIEQQAIQHALSCCIPPLHPSLHLHLHLP